MKYRLILPALAALALSSCAALLSTNNGDVTGAPKGGLVTSENVSSQVSGKLTSRGGYQPTDGDVSRYSDSLADFLQANVPNFGAYRNAAIIVDGKVKDNLSAVKLSRIKNITVMDKAPSLQVGTKSTSGAIVITTK